MSHKKKHKTHIPPGNQPKGGPESEPIAGEEHVHADSDAFQEQDPRRRSGGWSERAEHPYQQPGGLNDANH